MSTIDEFRSYVDKRARLDKLDSALLFLSSSLGFIFTIFQVLTQPLDSLAYFTPAFILGWALPFWYGYVRGGIQDSTINRYRGWIFFTVGLGSYALNLAFGALPGVPSSQERFVVLIGALGILNLSLVGGVLFLRAFTQFLFSLAIETRDAVTLEVARYTGITAAGIAATGWLLVGIRPPILLSVVLGLLASILIALVWDKSDFYAKGAMLHSKFERVSVQGRFYGSSVARGAHRVVRGLTQAIFAIGILLGISGLSVFVAVGLLGLGTLLLVPLTVLGHITRSHTSVRFLESPRKSRRQRILSYLKGRLEAERARNRLTSQLKSFVYKEGIPFCPVCNIAVNDIRLHRKWHMKQELAKKLP